MADSTPIPNLKVAHAWSWRDATLAVDLVIAVVLNRYSVVFPFALIVGLVIFALAVSFVWLWTSLSHGTLGNQLKSNRLSCSALAAVFAWIVIQSIFSLEAKSRQSSIQAATVAPQVAPSVQSGQPAPVAKSPIPNVTDPKVGFVPPARIFHLPIPTKQEYESAQRERRKKGDAELVKLAAQLNQEHPEYSAKRKDAWLVSEMRKKGFDIHPAAPGERNIVTVQLQDPVPCEEGHGITINGVHSTGKDMVAGVELDNVPCANVSNVVTEGAKYGVQVVNAPPPKSEGHK